MNHSFIQLMCWLLSFEITHEDDDKDRHLRTFSDIYDYILRTYVTQNESKVCAEKQIISDTFEDHREIGNKIINLYYSHSSDGDDSQLSERSKEIKLSNDFVIKRMIGQGSFGCVFEAVHKIDNSTYAIKISNLKDNDSENEKIVFETRLLAKTIHSLNMVQYFTAWTENNIKLDYMTDNDGIVISKSAEISQSVVDGEKMILLPGPVLCIQMKLCIMNLADARKKINNELNQNIGEPLTNIGAFIATQFFYEIVKGVEYLHSLSPPIIHRDLNLKNIFITDGRGGNFIKIGDFGIATFHGNISEPIITSDITQRIKHTSQVGTFKYMAPEVKKSVSYNEKCDIYSLGCIAFDLLCIDWNDVGIMNRKIFDEYIDEDHKHWSVLDSEICLDWNDLLINMLSNMTSEDPSFRPSCKEILTTKVYDSRKWLIEIKDITECEPLLYSIAINQNHIDKVSMNPLSHYILYHKLMMSKESDLDVYKRSLDYWADYGWEFDSIEEYNKVCNLILSDMFSIDSNLEKHIQRQTIEVIKRAFALHSTPKLIAIFIEDVLNGNCMHEKSSGMWSMCHFKPINGWKELKSINWMNLPYLYIYNFGKDARLCDNRLFIYQSLNIINDKMNESIQPSVINEYDSETTKLLLVY